MDSMEQCLEFWNMWQKSIEIGTKSAEINNSAASFMNSYNKIFNQSPVNIGLSNTVPHNNGHGNGIFDAYGNFVKMSFDMMKGIMNIYPNPGSLDKIVWVESLKELESEEIKTWGHKKFYKLYEAPEQSKLKELVEDLIKKDYKLKIADSHGLLREQKDNQTRENCAMFGWKQKLHIYGKKDEAEVVLKEEISSIPFMFVFDVPLYSVEILKNKCQLKDEDILKMIRN
jgi:hypothetical protein